MRWIWVVALLAMSDVWAGPQPRTQITIWATAAPVGGQTYGFVATGAMIFEQREVDVAANGEARIVNVAGTADPSSIQLRDLTDPGATITEQRFIPAAKSATEMIARRIGEQVTVVTPKGDITGTLRAIDDRSIVLETGSGDARRVSVMRREYASDVRLTGPVSDKPGVLWKLATRKAGKHSVEVTYRADGIGWGATYRAVLDEPGKLLDFSAQATIKNASGATFDNVGLTLVSGNAHGGILAKATPVLRFAIPNPVKLTADDVQLELFPPRIAAKVRPVVSYEAMPDPSGEAQDAPNTDCLTNNTDTSGGTSEVAIEVDVPSQGPLPDGRVRLFRKRAGRLEMVSEDQLRSSPGIVRIKLSPDGEITGERKAVTCSVDERTHTIREKVEVRLENKSAQPVDVIAREFLWRWLVWRVENESKKGVRAGPQTQEFRVRVGAKSSQTLTYTAVYSW